ncbi:SIZ1 (YDR409W) and NFI1 (YOR156C) [Zygosaccharomyces parabailii]|nr:SIZ1 (YDR409W) and NFI1 (YOR156C) [Zygosaccharomyces parabailii]
MVTNGSLSSSGRGLHQEIQEAIEQVDQLKVTELKSICRSIELPITGRKAVLQDRIRVYLKNSCSIGHIDPWRPKTIRALIDKVKLGEVLPKYDILWQSLKSGAYCHPVATGAQPVSTLQLQQMQQLQQQQIQQQPGQNIPGSYTPFRTISPNELSVTGNRTVTPKNRYMHFKESPFYKMKKLIQETAQKLNITNARGSCVARFRFTKADWSLLESDQKYKLYLFCGMVNSTGFESNQPIQFPYPNEIKVNNVQIKDNVRGLKNKPGTAKPADLTPYLRPPTQQNLLEIVYAFTKSEYYIYCYIVEQITPEDLLKEILQHPKIIKAATLHYIEKTSHEEEDDELVTTSTVMTLQCPVSYTRMRYPVKSIMCKHLQCFDALWYLYSQMQIPTWQCPVCQIDIDLKNLAICEFVDEILKNSHEDVEQVELSADGSWKPVVEEAPKPAERPPAQTSTKVKMEKFDDDGDKVLSAYSRRSSPSNEPVVISLDSDQEDEAMGTEEEVPVQKPPQNNSGPASLRTYVDDNDDGSQHTLDPRFNPTITPTAPRQHSMGAEDSIGYVAPHREIPNILGKTPLNNGEDTPLAEGYPASPTPSADARGIFTPAATTSPDSNAHLGLQEAPSERTVLRSHSGTLDPNASSSQVEPGSNSMLGMSGHINYPPNPSVTQTVQSVQSAQTAPTASIAPLAQTVQTAQTAQTASNASNTSKASNASNASTTSAISNCNENGSGKSNNLLGISGELSSLRTAPGNEPPPLPPLPDTRIRPPSRQPVPMRTRKPVVSPFMPPKPYLNMLPRKRHIFNPPSGTNSPQLGHSLGVSMEDRAVHRGTPQSDDVIDLTSD